MKIPKWFLLAGFLFRREVLYYGGITQKGILASVSDNIRLVDDAPGKASKQRMGDLQDERMAQDSNDKVWAGAFPMWNRRVLMTHWAGQEWNDMCQSFNFAAAGEEERLCFTYIYI